ncbi:MAG: hypothetical protein ACFFB5_21080 [Promethearchaeota archaeon]
MRRKSSIPYEETTVLSLLSLTADIKFQLIAKVKSVDQKKIIVTDDHEDLEIPLEEEEMIDFKAGDTITIFGEKLDSKIKREHIIKLNLNWDLYQQTREIELK